MIVSGLLLGGAARRPRYLVRSHASTPTRAEHARRVGWIRRIEDVPSGQYDSFKLIERVEAKDLKPELEEARDCC